MLREVSSQKSLKLTVEIVICSLIFVGLFPDAVQAQIRTDETTNTTLTSIDNGIRIDEGDRDQGNLFHSFREFSVPTGSEAFFNNDSAVVNIFSRVTGGNISNIDGLIRANGGANLFLINPAGILFGNNASLQIGGSFYGSTADSILFPEGVEFAATSQQEPILTINAPIGLRFRDNPGNIATNGGFLLVNPGNHLGLIGGNLNLDGSLLFAPGGSIELGGLTAAGDITITEDGSFSVPEAVTRGDINLSNFFRANVTGAEGTINLNGKNITFTGNSNLVGGINDLSNAQGGDINLNATEAISLNQDSDIFNPVSFGALGNSGDINIKANSLSLTEDNLIITSNFGLGNAGDINISIIEDVSISNGSILSNVLNPQIETGKGGNITIDADTLSLTNGSNFDVTAFGDGNITINVRNLELIDSVLKAGINPASQLIEAKAGDITINATEKITIAENNEFETGISNSVGELISFGQIGVVTTRGSAGNITLNTKVLEGNGAYEIISISNGIGDTGELTINATEDITLTGEDTNLEGELDLLEVTPTRILSVLGVLGIGEGADITITTPSVSLSNFLISTSTTGEGNAGNITLNIGKNIALTNDSQIQALSLGNGDAGDIVINADNADISLQGEQSLSLIGTSVISARAILEQFGFSPDSLQILGIPFTSTGEGGDIVIKANNLSLGNRAVLLTSTSGEATSEGLADSGNIFIDLAGNLTLMENASISSDTSGQGNGGQISINAGGDVLLDGETSIINAEEDVLLDGETSITTSVLLLPELLRDFDQSRQGGDIQITASNLSLNNGGQLRTNTQARGNAGKVTLNIADTVAIDGVGSNGLTSLITSEVNATAEGNAGDISIDTNKLRLTNGGLLSSSTNGIGNGGIISVNTTDSVEIIGIDNENLNGGIFSTSAENSVGNAGAINLTTSNLRISDLGEISVDNRGQGNSGTLFVIADNIALDNGASITAATQSGIGGEINLQADKNLELENDSFISARAFNQADGGNIEINAEFILGFPPQIEGNDLIASAEAGNGGNITITTEQIFGLNPGKATPRNLTNDIDVSSALGIQGTLAINTNNVDVSKGIIELSQNIIEAEQAVTQACNATVNLEETSGLTLQGRGGVPAIPTAPIFADYILMKEDLTVVPDLNPSLNNSDNIDLRQFAISTAKGDILPARGIVVKENGSVILTSYPISNSMVRIPDVMRNCQ